MEMKWLLNVTVHSNELFCHYQILSFIFFITIQNFPWNVLDMTGQSTTLLVEIGENFSWRTGVKRGCVVLRVLTTHTCSEAKERWESGLLNTRVEIQTDTGDDFCASLTEMSKGLEIEIMVDINFPGSWKSNVGAQTRLHSFFWLTVLSLHI